MADLTACCNGLAAVVAQIPNLRVSAQFTAQVNPPAAIVLPQQQQVLKYDTLDGAFSYLLRIVLLASYTEDVSSVTLMNSWLATTGASSVPALIKANPRLAGVYDYINLDMIRGYGLMEWAGQQYLGAQVMITVMAATP
jgi:hypothetical protein